MIVFGKENTPLSGIRCNKIEMAARPSGDPLNFSLPETPFSPPALPAA
jgi:hypothetical protein